MEVALEVGISVAPIQFTLFGEDSHEDISLQFPETLDRKLSMVEDKVTPIPVNAVE